MTDSGTKCAWVIHVSKVVRIHVHHSNRRCLYVPRVPGSVKNPHNNNQKGTALQEHSYHHRPSPAPASPESPPSKKVKKGSPAPATDRPIQDCSYHYEEEYPVHEKYDLQEVLSNKLHGNDVAIIKAQRIPEEDEMNIDLPAYFFHRPWKKDWLLIKGPTSKYHHEEFYTKMEELAESGKPQKNIISWFDFLERSCGDPSGKYPFVREEPR